MKKADVVIGNYYRAKVSGDVVRVRILREVYYGGWEAINLSTRRVIRIKTAARLRPDLRLDRPSPGCCTGNSLLDAPSGLNSERGTVPDCVYDLENN
jgi:hypothetical protein